MSLETKNNTRLSRTDFYYVPEGPHEDMGFPPGVAEELVVKVLRKCDPKSLTDGTAIPATNDDIMCSTVAQEVEIEAEYGSVETTEHNYCKTTEEHSSYLKDSQPKGAGDSTHEDTPDLSKDMSKVHIPEEYTPPVIPIQGNSESYNGAVRENYTWSQNIMELGNLFYYIFFNNISACALIFYPSEPLVCLQKGII